METTPRSDGLADQLAARIGRAIVAVQSGEPENVVVGLLRGQFVYDHNAVVPNENARHDPEFREAESRFWQKVQPTGYCWEWTAHRTKNGYGRVSFRGKSLVAHRVAYELLVGPIPKGMQVDHLCRNRGCVNPDHLEPVTPRENAIRAFSPAGIAVRTGVCQRGHSMDDAYRTKRADGKVVRRCRPCVRAAQRVRSAPTYERRCKECGGEFVGRQSNKVYCSAACVQRAYVKRRGANA